VLRFVVLGPVEAHDDGRDLNLGGGRQRALVARLLVDANEVVATERLIEDLWGSRPPASAAKLLQGHVSRLRRELGRDVIQTRASGYALRAGETDAAEFERLVSSARASRRSPSHAERTLRDALALWRGPPFADVAYEPWAQIEVTRLEELRLVAAEELLAARLELGAGAELVPELEALVREHPLSERLWSQLMLALYRSGRQAEALDVYRQARRRLMEDIGVEPTRSLRELEQAILRQDPELETVAGPEPGSGFIARRRELGELLAALDEAVAGRGGLFLIQGEPGVGKTRLADELIAHARTRGVRVLVGRCWEAGGAPAFWPWLQSLRTLIAEVAVGDLPSRLGAGAAELERLLTEVREHPPEPDDSASLDSEAARFRLFEAVSVLLRTSARERPFVLVLDDMHAADQPSLVLLQFLARTLLDSRLLVLVAYRDVDPTLRSGLVDVLSELTREPTTRRIALTGFSEPDVRRYIELISGRPPGDELVLAISDETDGNPFFIGEIVRLLAAEHKLDVATPQLVIPPTVREAIERRLRNVSPDCAYLLHSAAVLGREFGIDELASVVDLAAESLLVLLEEASAEKLLVDARGGGGRLTFAHALIRDTLYQSLGAARRARLHRRAAEALESLYGDDETHLTELAHHLVNAVPLGDADRAAGYAARAGDRAALLLAFEEALRLYAVAADLTHDPHARASLLERRARVLQLQGRLREARAELLDAVALYRGSGESLATGRVLIMLSNVLWRLGDPAKRDALDDALALLEPCPPSAELVAAFSELAGQRALETAHEQAIVAAQQALDLARSLGLSEPPRALGYRGQARAASGEREGIDDMRRALALAVDEGHDRAAAVLHNNLAQAIFLYEGPAAALAACSTGIEFCRHRRIDEWADYIASIRLTFLTWAGRADDAIAEADRLARAAAVSGDVPVLIEALATRLLLGVERHPGDLVEHARKSGEPYLIVVGLAAAAESFAARSDSEAALVLLREVERLPFVRDEPRYLALLPSLVRSALAVGDRRLAQALVDGSKPRTQLADHVLCTVGALLAEADGEHGDAASLYGEAARRWTDFENVPERDRALEGRARCMRSRGLTAGAPDATAS
jgi:DNA-binding SARP family transcriptional activator